jgi:pseudo-response regulator 7
VLLTLRISTISWLQSSVGASGTDTGKVAIPTSHGRSDNNMTGSNGDSDNGSNGDRDNGSNGDRDNGSSGLNFNGGSDNGSGNQVCNIS